MARLWHPFDKWEDYRHNFYGGIKEIGGSKKEALATYAELLRDTSKFEAALKVIVSEWKYSCEQNLTHEGMNRIAYLGQAACALRYGIPSDVASAGYNLLTIDEQYAADAMAKKYLDLWIEKHEKETGNHVNSQEIHRNGRPDSGESEDQADLRQVS